MPFLPFIPFPDAAEAVLKFLEGSQPWYLTLGFKYNSAVTIAELQTLETALDLWWSTYLAARISSTSVLQAIRVVGLTTATDPFVELPPATVPAGLLTGTNATSLNSAMVVTFNTALRGRSYRGRNFVGGRVAGEVANENSWTTVAVSAMQSVYVNLPGVVNPTGWQHMVLSRYLNNVRRTLGAATAVTGYVAKTQVGSQRARLHV